VNNRLLLPLVLLVTLLSGCGSSERAGCLCDGNIPDAEVQELERAAAGVYELARSGDTTRLFANAAESMKARGGSPETFGPMVGFLGGLEPFPTFETHSISVVHFGEKFPHVPRIQCPVPGEQWPQVLLLDPLPVVQASLVQTGPLRGETVYLSTLWHGERGMWKLAAASIRRATGGGKDWKHYDELAAEERLHNRTRNAALLYNLAIQLVLPNPWTQPPALRDLQRRQARLSVSHLPKGTIEEWPADRDTFRVRKATPIFLDPGEGLALLFEYPPVTAAADSVGRRAHARRLFEYIREEFPEYAEVFREVVLQTEATGEGGPFQETFPLSGGS
jgi:hypothetical protein